MFFLSQGKTLDLVQFSQNEAAFSVAVCTFTSRSDMEWFIVVGIANHMTLSPRACSGGALVLFKLSSDGAKLEHVHTVSVYDIDNSVYSIKYVQTDTCMPTVASRPAQHYILCTC